MEGRVKPRGSRGGIFGEQSRSGAGFRSVLYGIHLQLQSYSLLIYYGNGIASQYSESLRAGQSGFRTPVEARDILFSISAQTIAGFHPGSSTMDTLPLSWEYSGRSVYQPPTLF